MRPLAAPSSGHVRALALLVILSNAAGNYALNWGMKHGGVFTAWTLAGIGILIFWTLARLRLLAWADLSYVLPVTSIGYLIPVVFGAFLLEEPVSAARWVGAMLIAAGAGLVTPTRPRTERP